MLWVYINRQGDAECIVNVGNKIRQGDGFKMFIVLWGMNGEAENVPDASLFSVQNVRYLAAPNLSFVMADYTPTVAVNTFYLDNPVQANNKFISQTSYSGYLVDIPAEATSAAVNGGNIAIEINMLDNNGFAHAQTISVYVQPTYGAKQTNISMTDYNLIIDLLKQSNFLLSFAMTVDTNNGAHVLEDDPPTIFLSKQLGFVHGKISISRNELNDAHSAIPSDQDDGFATIAYLDSDNVVLKIPATIFGRDQNGNDVQFRLNNGSGNRINLDVYIDDIQDTSGTNSDTDVVTFFGTCWIDAEYLDFTQGTTSGRVISAVTASAVELPSSSQPTVDVELVSSDVDDNSATMNFEFGIPKGEKGDTGAAGAAAGIGRVTAHGSATQSPTNEVSVAAGVTTSGTNASKNFDFSFAFNLPTMITITDVGAIAFSVGNNGHLYVHTATDSASGLSIDQNTGHLILTY